MPEEIFFIIVIALLSGTALGIIAQVKHYKELKNGYRSQVSKGASLRTSELEEMMERAAQKAVRPLVKRVENLEAILVDEDDTPDLLTDADTYFETDPIKSRIKVTRRGSDSRKQ